jgi:protein O-mannosyl-transferase
VNATVSNRNSRWLSSAICVVLTVVTGCLYWCVHTHAFIQLDDPDYVTSNPYVRTGLTPAGIQWAFTQSHSSNWHPLTWITHMLDCQLFGLNNPGGHHLVNVGLHIANTLLLFLLLQRLTGKRWPSAFVAALFALHPLHVESVAWVAERKDVLSTFFFLLTLFAYAAYAARKENRGLKMAGASSFILHPPSSTTPRPALWYVLALLLFALGLMSKPMLVTLPCVLLLLDYWPLRRFGFSTLPALRSTLRPLLLEKLPFFALSAVSCVITIWAQAAGRSIASADEVPLSFRVTNALSAYLQYVEKMLWPAKLAIFYPFPAQVHLNATLLAVVFVVAVTILALWQARERPYLLVGWLWYLGTLIPVIGLLQVGAQAVADRYTYIPLIGLFLAIALGIAELATRWRPLQLLLWPCALALLAACSFQTSRQLTAWKDNDTLFVHAAKITPGNYLALAVLGDIRIREGKNAEAVEYLSQAIEFGPHYVPSRFRLAVALDGLGRTEEALTNYQMALQMDPLNGEPRNAYGVSLMEHGKLGEAEVQLREAHRLKPDDTLVWLNLVLLLRREGKLGDALHECEAMLQLDPTSERSHLLYGETLRLVGRFEEGYQQYAAALRLNPKSASAHVGLGLALIDKGNFTGASAQFEALLKDEPQNPQALDGLGYALAMQRRFDEAKAKFLEAQRLDPKYAQGYFHYAMCLSARNDVKEAVAQYRKALNLNPKMPLALNNLAWLLASDPDPNNRNGKEAVELSEEACKLVNYEQPFYMGTLAAAYAEAGRFADAVNMAERARDLARSRGVEIVAQRNEELLKLYRAGQPYHEPALNPDGASSK